jgi:hypothetical protein
MGNETVANGSELALILEGGKAAHENHSANMHRQIERIGFVEMAAIAAPAFAAAIASACAVVYYSANHATLAAGLDDLAVILAWFCGAILLSMTVPGFSRLRHYTHTLGLAHQKLDFQAPYVHENRRSRLLIQTSQVCQFAALAAMAASYAALTVGGIAFLEIMR